MSRRAQAIWGALLACACARGPEGRGLEVIVNVDPGGLASCIRVEARSKGEVFTTRGVPRKDTVSVGIVSSAALGNPVSVIARGYSGPGCGDPQRLNLESEVVETTFEADQVRRITLELHAPAREVDRDGDGHRDVLLEGPDCNDTRASAHPGAEELCGNGEDDDCDGVADCAQPSCLDRGPPERCDGKDNDCDGQSDEGFGLGFLCTAGFAACERQGQVICAADGLSAICSQTPDTELAIDEACNGLDDDCDGVADNGFSVGAVCQAGLGPCQRAGEVQCLGDGGASCSASADLSSAGRELCDGLDNDCDGQVDQRPQCGGPSQDVAESVSTTWAVAESLGDVVEPCSDVTRGLVSLAAETGAPWVLAGTEAMRVNYGPDGAAFFGAHYPSMRDAGWDLSTRTGLSVAISGLQPATYGGWSPAAPTVVLCGRDGGYLQLDPLVNLLLTDAGTVSLQVPLAGDGGWVARSVGGFDLRAVDSLEVHADPARGLGTGTCSVWLDDVHFY